MFFFLHLLLATLIPAIVAILASLLLWRGAADPPGFFLPLLASALLGYFVSAKTRDHSARWIWTVPCTLLLLNLFYSHQQTLETWPAVARDFLGLACDSCMNSIFFTMPFYTTLIYSLASLVHPLRPKAHTDA